jgi:hypothetical protein
VTSRERRAAAVREVDQHKLRAGWPGLCVLCGGPYKKGERVIRVQSDVAHRGCAIKAALADETEQ